MRADQEDEAREDLGRCVVPADGGPDDRRGPPQRHRAGAVLRPVLRGRRGPGRLGAPPRDRRGPRRRRRGRLRHGVLRHLVGVDELHLVRLGLRHRRRRLPADHPGPDRRGPDPGRRRARRHGRQRLRRDHLRVRGHAPGHGHPVAAGGRHRPAPPAQLAAVRHRHRGRAGRLGAAPGPPRRARPGQLPGPGRGRAGRPHLGRAGRPDQLAPAPHRRALRPVHPDRPRRVRARLHPGHPDGPRRGRRPGRPGHHGGRRAADRVRDVVAVLRQGGPRAPDLAAGRDHLGLRALPGVRLGRGRRGRPGRQRRLPHRPRGHRGPRLGGRLHHPGGPVPAGRLGPPGPAPPPGPLARRRDPGHRRPGPGLDPWPRARPGHRHPGRGHDRRLPGRPPPPGRRPGP